METLNASTGSVTVSDGTTIRYISAGPASGPVLVFIHGWHQTAIQWRKQLAHFSTKHRTIAIDHRGHGESDKPRRGYRVARLAADLHELITQLDLQDAVLVGHSMGCGVIWSYWDTFADSRARVSKLVLVDQATCMTANPTWEEGVARSLAAVLPPAAPFGIGASLCGPDREQAVGRIIKTMVSPSLSQEDFKWMVEQNMKCDGENAAAMMANQAFQDWRDVIPTINVPSLVIGAEASLFNKEGIEWIAAHLPAAQLEIFKKEEGGSHFMFWENEEKFNRLVEEFLAKQ